MGGLGLMVGGVSLVRELQDRQLRREQIGENSARQAVSYTTFSTTGVGQIAVATPIMFDSPMLREPAVSSGAVVRRLPDPDVAGFPRVTAGVLRWELDDRGFYVGAYAYFTIDCPPVDPMAVPGSEAYNDWVVSLTRRRPEVLHHLWFTNTSYKPASSAGRAFDSEPSIPPRETPTGAEVR